MIACADMFDRILLLYIYSVYKFEWIPQTSEKTRCVFLINSL